MPSPIPLVDPVTNAARLCKLISGSLCVPSPKSFEPPCPGRRKLAAIGVIAAFCYAARAVAATIALTPANSEIGYTIYQFGLFPVQARFTQFGGTLDLDRAAPGRCQVRVWVQLASLQMEDRGKQDMALGPSLLDAAHFPQMAFSGTCQGSKVVGQLTLHGLTHALTLQTTPDRDTMLAYGTIRRRDYGISGLRMVISPLVHLRLRVPISK